MLQHAIHQPRQFVCGRRHRLGLAQLRRYSAQVRAQRATTPVQAGCRHAHGSRRPVGARSRLAAQHLPTRHLRAWTQAKPRRRVLDRFPAPHIVPDGTDGGQCRRGIDAINPREIHTSEAVELGLCIKVEGIA